MISVHISPKFKSFTHQNTKVTKQNQNKDATKTKHDNLKHLVRILIYFFLINIKLYLSMTI